MEFYNNANAWSNNLAVANEVVNNFLPNSLDDQIGGAAGIPNIPLPPPLDFEAPLTFEFPNFDPLDPIFDILPCPTNGTFADDYWPPLYDLSNNDYIQPQDLIYTGLAQPTLTNHESSINSFNMILPSPPNGAFAEDWRLSNSINKTDNIQVIEDLNQNLNFTCQPQPTLTNHEPSTTMCQFPINPFPMILPSPTNGVFAKDLRLPNMSNNNNIQLEALNQNLEFTCPAHEPLTTMLQSLMNPFPMEQNQQQNSLSFDDRYKQGGQSSNLIQEKIMESEIPTRESEDSNQENHKGLDDGYNWRKYGNKKTTKIKSSKSYFKCTYPGCPAKKTIRTSLNGLNITVVNTKEHNHLKPVYRRRSSSLTYQNDLSSGQFGRENSLESQRFSSSGDDLDDDEPQVQPRTEEDDENEILSEVREARAVIQVTSDNDVLDDGYKWRKYGEKVVKGNPNPRRYYKCTSKFCSVKKQVERAADDPKDLIVSYKGKHNHDFPITRGSSQSTTNTATEVPSMATIPSPTNYMANNSYQNNTQNGIL